MVWWIGVLLVLLAGYQVYRGQTSESSDTGGFSSVRRSEKPVQFWLVVLLELVFAALFLAGVIHF